MIFEIVLGTSTAEDVCLETLVTASVAAIAIVTGRTALRYKTKTLAWFFLSFLTGALMIGMDQVSSVLLNPFLLRFTYSVMLSAWLLCWVIFENYSMKMNANAPLLVLTFVIIGGLLYICWNPGCEITVQDRSFVISSIEFVLVMYFMPILLFFLIFYWTLNTYIHAPLFVKKSAAWLLLGGALGLAASISYILVPLIFVIGLEASCAIISCYVIYKHPGLVSFVPYKAQYMSVLNKDGDILFERWWNKEYSITNHDLTTTDDKDREKKKNLITALKRFDNILKVMKNEDRVIEIEVDSDIYLVNNSSEHFFVGLIAKNTSKALHEGLAIFIKILDKIYEDSNQAIPADFYEQIESMIECQMLNIHAITDRGTNRKN
nr:hypothetical protein [Candidatus Sigynarchaeota archaeon]